MDELDEAVVKELSIHRRIINIRQHQEKKANQWCLQIHTQRSKILAIRKGMATRLTVPLPRDGKLKAQLLRMSGNLNKSL